MKTKHLIAGLAGSLTISLCGIASAKSTVHESVQSALNWHLPEMECTKPLLRGQGIAIVDGTGDRTQTDVDSYTLNRHARKMKRYESCLSAYKDVLNTDFETLKGSVQYGLTGAQANTILENMKLIQSTIISLNK